MVDRKEVQAGDDAVGDDEAGQQNQQVQADVLDADLGGLSADEQKAFEEMRANDSARPAEIVQDGDPDDAQAAADKAAAASKPDQQADADDDGDDDESQAGDQQQAAADDNTDPTQGGRFPQRVNYRKYKRATERAAALEKELATEREKSTRIDERIKLLSEAMTAKPQAKQEQQEEADPDDIGEMPDPDKDIFGAMSWQAKKIAQLERQISGVTTHVVGRDADQTLERTYISDIKRFAADKDNGAPDFSEAYTYLMATRMRQLSMQTYDIDPMEEGQTLTRDQYDKLAAVVQREERSLVSDAINKGRSPAKAIYGMAKTFGYTKAAPAAGGEQQQQNGGAKPGNGAAKPAQGQQQNGQRPSAVAAAVAAARRGAETNKSLSEGGGAPEGQLTAEQVLTMNEDDFARFMNTATPDQIRQVLGQ